MANYTFKATGLIAKTFDEKDIKYTVRSYTSSEMVEAGFGIDNGPNAIVRFISRDNDNDVAIRVYSVINDVSEAKRARILEACNIINDKYRYLKFVLDSENDVNVEYDLPIAIGDNEVGEAATRIFFAFMRTLDKMYPLLAKALYTDAPLVEPEAEGSSN